MAKGGQTKLPPGGMAQEQPGPTAPLFFLKKKD